MIQRIPSIWIVLCGNTVMRVGKNSTLTQAQPALPLCGG
jgi:hypothetical protein